MLIKNHDEAEPKLSSLNSNIKL